MLPRFVIDPLVRRKSRFADLPVQKYLVRRAVTATDYEDAFRLLHVAYAFQGIEPVGRRIMRMTSQHVLPEAVVLNAYDDQGIVVGTVTSTLDSPAGLPLDHDYPEEVAALRQPGAQLFEIGSFAVVRRCWADGVAQILAAAAARIGFSLLDSSHCVIGIHPKATGFYRAVWGFGHLGSPKKHSDLEAPVAAMVGERDVMNRHLRRHFSQPVPGGAPMAEHLFGAAPIPGCELAEGDFSPGLMPRMPRMPRAVFRSLFVERTNHLAEVDSATQGYVRKQRTDETLGPLVLAS